MRGLKYSCRLLLLVTLVNRRVNVWSSYVGFAADAVVRFDAAQAVQNSHSIRSSPSDLSERE